MRERVGALQLGEREGLGEFRCVASRAFGHDWIFFTPVGLLVLAGSCWALLRHGHSALDRAGLAVCGIGGLAFACLPLVYVFDRRPGSEVPRLYCFTDGVVIAARRTLTSYRWTELTIDHKHWTSGSGETYDSGTSITVKSVHDGTAVAYFTGNEPSRARGTAVVGLHRAAWERAGLPDS